MINKILKARKYKQEFISKTVLGMKGKSLPKFVRRQDKTVPFRNKLIETERKDILTPFEIKVIKDNIRNGVMRSNNNLMTKKKKAIFSTLDNTQFKEFKIGNYKSNIC